MKTDADAAYTDVRIQSDARAKLLIDISAFVKTKEDADALIRWLAAFRSLLISESSERSIQE